ncbi:Zinc knuckle CX2CX3GHX4C [Dillenia turbinata]|uniref:Zinc knuckle CX2CX3GHX4C n=1 Tax=Dillenia turbinata TaxID=194707 RepID=A0AAN8VK38_9MAGN
MAVYYKFKSAKDYDSVQIDGHFISVANLKEKIFESKHLGRGTDFDLVVTNAQTNEEYLDEAMLIPKNTSVLIRRVPGRPRMPIITQQEEMKVEIKSEESQPTKTSLLGGIESSVPRETEDTEWDEFGNDLYAIPEAMPVQHANPILDAPLPSKADEDSKIKALIDTPALDWQRQPDGFGAGRGFGRGVGGRVMGGRGFGRGGLERKTPPQGYICHRCKVPGHFIQHCPTNGDPNYDIKRVKPPTGIPKSMLVANPDGSYALPSGAVAVLRPNEAAFEKEIEGLPSTRSVGDLPPELHCPLCREVMKDAVLTSKCCFKSFCDKCVRDYIISKSMCVCGATSILADDLLPNKTLRDTINRILESNNDSVENAGNMESARCPPPKIPSPTLSAASKGEQMLPPRTEETQNLKEGADEVKVANVVQQTLEKGKAVKVPDVSEATHESMSVKEPASQGSALLAEEEVQQRLAAGEAGKKKKKKKPRLPVNGFTPVDLQWRNAQDLAAESFMMPMAPGYNPYWTGMQTGMEGYVPPFAGAMPYMGHGLGPLDVPFAGVMPPDLFGPQGYMMPMVPPQRDLAEFGMGFNAGPPVMTREEFEARTADLRRNRESERRVESKELQRDMEFVREMSSGGDVSSMKSKSKPIPSSSGDHHRRTQSHRSERSEGLLSPSPERSFARDHLEPPPPPRPSKRKSSDHQHHDRDDTDHDRDREREREREKERARDLDHHHRHHHRSESYSSVKPSSSEPPAKPPVTVSDRKQKASVFSRISFPDEETVKKRKVSSSAAAETVAPPSSSSSHHHGHRALNGYREEYTKVASGKRSGAVDYESSDEERHFKRKPSRYEPSPPPPDWEEEGRHSGGGSKDGERDRRR